MICPVCKKPMIVVEHQKIELDYCPSCEGVWFDSGELELLLQKAELEDTGLVMSNILDSPEHKVEHQERKCPICGRRMKETGFSGPQSLEMVPALRLTPASNVASGVMRPSVKSSARLSRNSST